MSQWLDYREANPHALQGLFRLEQAARQGGIEQPLLELVRMRASQINGCAYCLSARAQFSESEIVGLTIAIVAINGWNRLAIPFRTPPGLYTRATDGRGATA